jgi:CubicO group peptidase (beta-lactamase class C family)
MARLQFSRRSFLAQTSTAALAGFLPSLGCSGHGNNESDSAADDPVTTALTRDLESRIGAWMSETGTPGVGFCLIRNAEIAWASGFGVSDASSQAKVDADTTFAAASLSKPVFAYVAMKLCETGVLELDTPLTHYSRTRFLDGDPRLDRMTTRHILSHTGGFQNWRSDEKPLAIHFTPGEKHQYSGEGYNYLQTVVTQLLGQPFESYMQTRLFTPLNMTSSCYICEGMSDSRIARPHDKGGKVFTENKATPESVARYGAAGSLRTTPADYARFMISLIEPPPANEHLLQRASVAEMLRPHVKIDSAQFPASWALGWQIIHSGDHDFIFHGGDNDGFHSMAVASVAGRCGFVAMTNGENGALLLNKLLLYDGTQRFLAGASAQ